MSEGHAVNRKLYWIIFVALAVLTALEVGVAKLTGIGHGTMVVALVGLALTKAGLVLMFYMHLMHETPVLKKTVILPFLFPTLYAFVLISEGVWRGLYGQIR
jgi:cytochrome c oxidase subunit 4